MEQSGWLTRLGHLFYIVNPKQSAFETPEKVPNYVVEVVPLFIGLILLEICISSYKNKKKKSISVNDGAGSISQGMAQQLTKVITKGLEFVAYTYIYENWRLATLPWDSVWTWLLCFTCVDFFYYWAHRASHEINILWGSHQVHHSSEYYNLTTALRQSMFQDYAVAVFYLPMALAVPPSLYLVHGQFNLLYQFWIHTELISTLGPLEYILNTPSHHRVHHGRNRYCIDKNYAGTLIIWDRMFGTFEAENEEVVYGLTHPINTFSTFQIQLCHYMHIWRTFWSISGWKNKLSVLFKGPGWEPGKPWHGCLEDIPDVQAPMERYDPQIPWWCTVYACVHFFLVILGHIEITERCESFSQKILFCAIAYQLLSLTTLGALLDGRVYGPWLEMLRCVLFMLVDYYVLPVTRVITPSNATMLIGTTLFLRTCFISSAFLWFCYCFKTTSIHRHAKTT